MKLLFTVKTAYGVDRFYPCNDGSHAICRVASMKSLLLAHVKCLQTAGFVIEEIAPTMDERLGQ